MTGASDLPPNLPPNLPGQIAASWARLLDVDSVGPHEDLFDAGGTSLTLIRFLGEVQQDFGVELPLEQLFTDDLTPTAVAAAITEAVADGRSVAEEPS